MTDLTADRISAGVCTTCGEQMVIEDIDGHDSWICNNDGTAWAVDQEWAWSDLEEE